MSHNIFVDALREAEQNLLRTETQFRELEEERAKLQSLVASLNEYLTGRVSFEATDVSLPPTPVVARFETRPPTWQVIRDIMAERPFPMSVPQIHAVAEKLGLNTKKDALRIAMLRRKDIFKGDGSGLYELVGVNEPKEGLGNVLDIAPYQQQAFG